MTTNKIEVAVECETWGMTAPFGQRTADVIEQPSLEAARRLARVLAAEHGPHCIIAIRVKDCDQSRRVVEDRLGEREDCEQTERKLIASMLARGQGRAEICDRIRWARGHGLVADDVADALEREVLGRVLEP
jgi:hypothetical protein